jgi:hypothetical protein
MYTIDAVGKALKIKQLAAHTPSSLKTNINNKTTNGCIINLIKHITPVSIVPLKIFVFPSDNPIANNEHGAEI